ncbi:hypothetical protein TIFTF001_031371 [Ficus carica]|uniref:Uncharacterized protein n=1 Tax=Ficus carica TaxID=3494 RepID=A0AA88J525_FICCA|nr:hypothetical protein TIFTF001_031371 [Ficus carica]
MAVVRDSIDSGRERRRVASAIENERERVWRWLGFRGVSRIHHDANLSWVLFNAKEGHFVLETRFSLTFLFSQDGINHHQTTVVKEIRDGTSDSSSSSSLCGDGGL